MKTPVSRVKLGKAKPRRISGGGRTARGSPSKLCEGTVLLNLSGDMAGRSRKLKKTPSPSPRPHRKYEMSPVEMPSSQAPIPDREVFWDMDTPESRRNRERIVAEVKMIPNSPVIQSSLVVNKIRHSKRNCKSTEGEDNRGQEVLQDLLKLNAEINNSKEDKKPTRSSEPSSPVPLREISAEETSNGNDLIFEDDLFENSDSFGQQNDSLQNEFDDEDDDDFLFAASQVAQAIEQNYKTSTTNKLENVPQPEASVCDSKTKIEVPEVTNGNNDFDGFDDSFDELLSQVEIPVEKKESSPVLRKPNQPRNPQPSVDPGPGPSHTKIKSRVTSCKAFNHVNDSFDDLLSQMEMPEVEAEVKVPLQSNNLQSTSDNRGQIRKYSSFGSPGTDKKIFGKKFRSDSQIEKMRCSKEEIEQKKRMALERRNKSASQKRRL